MHASEVHLREIELSDSPLVHSWLNDAETVLTGFTDPVMPQSLERVYSRLQRWKEDNLRRDYIIEVVLPEGTRGVGLGQVYHIDYRNRSCEIGLVIGDLDVRGQGVGKIALAVVLQLAFNQMNLHRSVYRVFGAHMPSLKLAESFGMKAEGVEREAVFKNGRYWDIHRYALLSSEYCVNGGAI